MADKSISLTGPIITIIYAPSMTIEDSRLLVIYSAKEAYYSAKYTYTYLSSFRNKAIISKSTDGTKITMVKLPLTIFLNRSVPIPK